MDFWTLRLRFGLLNWTFWVFLLLAEHAGASVCAMKSAPPDFGMDPFLGLSRHHNLKDLLYTFELVLNKKNTKLQPKVVQNSVQYELLREIAVKDVSF